MCRGYCVRSQDALASFMQTHGAVASASELSRLRPKRLVRLVHPDALDAILFFPDFPRVLRWWSWEMSLTRKRMVGRKSVREREKPNCRSDGASFYWGKGSCDIVL